MKILLCRSNTIGSWAIRILTWSPWSHAVLINRDDAVEATWPRVQQTTAAKVIAKHSAYTFVDLPCWSPDLAWKAAQSQIGQPYDWTALVGFLFHRDWEKAGSWFCSELVAWSFAQGGTPLFRPDVAKRITPYDLWLLPPVEGFDGSKSMT